MASMQSHFEINVAKHNHVTGRFEHFLATHERSCLTTDKCRQVYEALHAAFPSPTYQITITWWQAGGHTEDPANIKGWRQS